MEALHKFTGSRRSNGGPREKSMRGTHYSQADGARELSVEKARRNAGAGDGVVDERPPWLIHTPRNYIEV